MEDEENERDEGGERSAYKCRDEGWEGSSCIVLEVRSLLIDYYLRSRTRVWRDG